MKKPLKFTSRGRFLNALKLNNVARDFENMDLKPFIVLNVLYMTRGMLTIIPKDIRYIVRTLATLSLEHNRIATLDGMYNITFHKLRNLILSHNKISRIAAQLLQLPMVMRINLKDNQLKQLEDMRFSTWGIGHDFPMVDIIIQRNPWHCNESMEVFIKTLCERHYFINARWKPSKIMLGLPDMVCDSPANVTGELVRSVFQGAVQDMDNCDRGWLLEVKLLIDLAIYL